MILFPELKEFLAFKILFSYTGKLKFCFFTEKLKFCFFTEKLKCRLFFGIVGGALYVLF